MQGKLKARLWAFYLPQFHPIPENDKWWGEGFTEWTNVRKAKPLFPGHHQPVVPGELGYYDLIKQPEIRDRQASLAREYGIDGFVYWHYWFGNGKMLLEKPFAEVLRTGKPDFPFALAWANESWRGFAHGLDNERQVLIGQEYPGDEDTIAHFKYVLPAFRDHRYLKIDGKPVFFVYKPKQNPYMAHFLQHWRKLAEESGLRGIFFVGMHPSVYGKNTSFEVLSSIKGYGFDAVNVVSMFANLKYSALIRIARKLFRNRWIKAIPDICLWDADCMRFCLDNNIDVIPNIGTGWDHTPRSGLNGLVKIGFTPEKFRKALADKITMVMSKPFDRRVITIKSWNEWAEGNIIEPDKRWGRRTLEAIRDVVMERQ